MSGVLKGPVSFIFEVTKPQEALSFHSLGYICILSVGRERNPPPPGVGIGLTGTRPTEYSLELHSRSIANQVSECRIKANDSVSRTGPPSCPLPAPTPASGDFADSRLH